MYKDSSSTIKGILTTNRLSFDLENIIPDSQVGKLRAHLLDKLVQKLPGLFVAHIPISDILMGGENGCYGAAYARLISDDPLRSSTPVARGPHIEFLKAYVKHGEEIFHPARFALTKYWENADRCIEAQGHYFGATTLDGVIEQAKRFARMLDGERLPPSGTWHSADGQPVYVRRIDLSTCYQVFDGNHRLAVALFRGAKRYRCVVLPVEPVRTLMQQMVIDSSLAQGALYQPIDLPEFRSWPVTTGCSDRLETIRALLAKRGVRPASYLDIGCGYGWFVQQMSKQGCEAFGVERDSAAVAVGKAVYGLDSSSLAIEDACKFLSRTERRYDVVSCFSILRQAWNGNASIAPIEFIRRVDSVTGTILFLDIGEADDACMLHWLQDNTSFASLELLSTYQGSHLFACSRS
jgi:SAM-dependent methyltransferase